MKKNIAYLCMICVTSLYPHISTADSVERFQMNESEMIENERAGLTKPITYHASCKSIATIDSMKPAGKLESGKDIDLILISKKTRQIYLLNENKVIFKHPVTFGRAFDKGPKIQEGDNRTPEGIYSIDYKNLDSKFHKSLHISYPSKYDREFAKQNGLSVGGDIMIHGLPNYKGNANDAKSDRFNRRNWTAGCVATRNSTTDQMINIIKINTTVAICPL